MVQQARKTFGRSIGWSGLGRVKRASVLALGCLAMWVLTVPSAAVAKDRVRIATWNLSNLHHAAGQSVPGRDVVRSEEDYTWLRYYADALEADVVALQEIHSRAAAYRLFSPRRWTVLISGRRMRDFDIYDRTGEWPDGTIYTGIAVRNSFTVLRDEDVASLEVSHVDPETGVARPTRWAKEVEIERDGRRLVVLAVHLKSGCVVGGLGEAGLGGDVSAFEHPSDPDCTTAARQVEPLQNWIRARSEGDVPYVIMGDFNRAFDVKDEDDDLWRAMNQPLGDRQELVRFPDRKSATCWKNAPPARYYRNPIDFIVLDPRAAEWAASRSFGWVTYDTDLSVRAAQISDHCPAYLDLKWPGEG